MNTRLIDIDYVRGESSLRGVTLAVILGLLLVSVITHAQSFTLSPGVEKTVAGYQYAVSADFRSKGNWYFGGFYQSSIGSAVEGGSAKQTLYGVRTAFPLAKAENLAFLVNLRMGLADNQFVAVIPGVETEIKLTRQLSFVLGTSVRMRQLAASGKVVIKLF
jgi:hypothetical protein